MRRFNFADLKDRVSWGSVIGGVMTVLAISILLSLLGSSIGLFMLDPLADHPASGIGTTVGIWSAVAFVISMIAGGFVAGKLSGVDGMIHGFLVWCTTLFIAVILGVMITIGAAKLTMNALGAVTSVAGSIISGAGSVVGGGITALSDQAKELFGDIDFNSDLNDSDVPQNIRTALAQSGVKELQPTYLKNQLNEVKTDLSKSLKKVIANPKDADNIINNFIDRLKKRTDKITKNIDRNDLSRAIANNTNLSKAEADKAIDQYIDIINKATDQAKQEINTLEQKLQEAAQEWNEMKHEALVAADKASDTAAKSALISFFALLVAAILCTVAGSWGSRKTQDHVEM
ncbi:YrzE family protein [uncultured Bacteroides sp.]|uniref:YrzE family protein n=1 Tax=uncultured Bacteroides sp. TaxID=162156 RepID=UPI0025E34E33|nr:hypothetical protein [uncultured Bacteroides sp.]